jgi:hypothetical protein
MQAQSPKENNRDTGDGPLDLFVKQTGIASTSMQVQTDSSLNFCHDFHRARTTASSMETASVR